MMDERKIFYSEAGSPEHVIYSPKLNKDGSFELIETGVENIQEYIDSFAEDTCMAVIIKRCEMGDTSVLSKHQGMYGDFTEVPKTYRDILQSVIDGENYFDSLPIEIKNKFGNSFSVWFSQIGEKEWFEAMQPSSDPVPAGIDVPDIPGPIEKEVKDNA